MKITSAQWIDFTMLALRWYLAYYMADYGIGKLTGEQFGIVDSSLLDKPLREIDKFHLAWYVFSLDKSFNIVVGLSQLLCAVLLVVNRTVILGALFIIPLLINILLIDWAYTTDIFGYALVFRIIGMLVVTCSILYYHKKTILLALKNITNLTISFRYKWWVYLFLPIIGLSIDFILALLMLPLKWVLQ